LHYAALAATAGVPLVVLALAVRADDPATVVKLALVGALLFGTGPATTVVTARARSRSSPGEDS
jgi:multisubunit Na+/H+ antiporter MnhG subunit